MTVSAILVGVRLSDDAPIRPAAESSSPGRPALTGRSVAVALMAALTAACVLDAQGNTKGANAGIAITASPPDPDGLANAPAGRPQLPNLFSGYAVRPPWHVAGVDYYVGVPERMTLRAPTAATLPAGVSVNGQTITVSGNNVTLNGFDLSGNGGYGIYIDSGVSGTRITNNLFVDSSATAPPAVVAGAGASDTYIGYNTINGGGAKGNTGYGETIYNQGSGLTVEYNFIANVPQHFVTTSGGLLIYKCNLMVNGGMATGAHLNFLQFTGSRSNPDALIAFNTLIQAKTAGGAGEGFQTYNNGTGAITAAVIRNNTMVSLARPVQPAPPGPAVSYWLHPNDSTTIKDNYFGMRSTYGAIYPHSGGSASNNINLATGERL